MTVISQPIFTWRKAFIDSLDRGHVLKVVAPEGVEDAIDESVAALMLTHVDYGSGRMHDMARLTEKAHGAGALAIWDLAHSAGAVTVDLAGSGADFAAGCTYKYLNGGPGAPAFIYVRPSLIDEIRPSLSGWLGHEAPFDFALDYRPARGIGRMRVGTPPVVQMSILEAALEIWEGMDMGQIRARSIELTELFIQEVEARCPMLALASPRDPALARFAGHLSLRARLCGDAGHDRVRRHRRFPCARPDALRLRASLYRRRRRPARGGYSGARACRSRLGSPGI